MGHTGLEAGFIAQYDRRMRAVVDPPPTGGDGSPMFTHLDRLSAIELYRALSPGPTGGAWRGLGKIDGSGAEMSGPTFHPSRSERRVLAGLLIGGVVIAAVGAAVASSLGVWDLEPPDVVGSLAGQGLELWIWGNLLLGFGVVLTSAGMAALGASIGGALARSGSALAVIAGSLAAVGFLIQGVGNAEAAELLARTGDMPGGVLILSAIQEGLLTFFGGLASLGTAAIGGGILQARWPSRGVGVAVVGLALVALALLPFNVPFLALLGALAAGIGLLTPTHQSATVIGPPGS